MLSWGWMSVMGSSALVAALFGSGITQWALQARMRARERKLADAARGHVEASTLQLRATVNRLQLDLQAERTASRQRVAAGISEQRQQVVRLESQLKQAYAQLDRLRSEGAPAADWSSETQGTGFAVTQPFMDDRAPT